MPALASAKWKTYLVGARPQFLLLSVVLVLLGTSVANYEGAFDVGRALLASVGLVLAHISTNTLNDYSDFRSGIDLNTDRSVFNGGSGILPASLLQPKQMLWYGVATLALAATVGAMFVFIVGWLLLPVLFVGWATVVLYTPVMTRIGWPEWVPGVGLGALPVLGAYYIQTEAYSTAVLWVAVPSGILAHNLLLLNEFPDVDADRAGGRRTLPIVLGKSVATVIYAVLTVAVFLAIVFGALTSKMPTATLLALLAMPVAIMAIVGAFHHQEPAKFAAALRNNVIVVLATQVLLSVGYSLA